MGRRVPLAWICQSNEAHDRAHGADHDKKVKEGQDAEYQATVFG